MTTRTKLFALSSFVIAMGAIASPRTASASVKASMYFECCDKISDEECVDDCIAVCVQEIGQECVFTSGGGCAAGFFCS